MNNPPISLIIPSTTIPWPFNYTFYKNNFTDLEGDTFTISCTGKNSGGTTISWMLS